MIQGINMNTVILISDQKLLRGTVVKTYPDGRVKAAFQHSACHPEEKILPIDRFRYPNDLCAVYMSKHGKTFFVDHEIDRTEAMWSGTCKLDTAENHYRNSR